MAGLVGLAAAEMRKLAVGPNPESVTRGFDGRLFVTLMGESRKPGDGDGRIVVIDGEQVRTFASGFHDPKGLVFTGDSLVTADFDRVLRIDREGRVTVLAGANAFPIPPVYLNDVVLAPDRRSVLVTDMGARDKIRSPAGPLWPVDSAEARAIPAIGRVFRVNFDGKVTVAVEARPEMRCPNGIDVTADGRIRVAEFFGGNVLEFAADGHGAPRVLARGFRSGDGLGHDVAGNLYVSEVFTGRVARVRPGGQIEELATGLRSAADFLLEKDQLVVPDSAAGELVFIPLP